MITSEEVERLNLGIQPINIESCLFVENALNWVTENTTVEFNINDPENVPASVKLFVLKYIEVMKISSGVSSESIAGMSQSFDTSNRCNLLMNIASDIFGTQLKSAFSFVSAEKRWR